MYQFSYLSLGAGIQSSAMVEMVKGFSKVSITGAIPGTKRATDPQRRHTPLDLCKWLVTVARMAKPGYFSEDELLELDL
jgi:hypothetical protein